MNKVILGSVAVLVVIAGFVYWYDTDTTAPTTRTEDGTEQQREIAAEDTNTDRAETTKNHVILGENTTGNTILVASATLDADGYIALYQVSNEGEAEYIGATQLLEAGTYADMTLVLADAVEAEESIIAVLIADNGDGVLSIETDAALTNPNDPLVSDIDVIDVPPQEESDALLLQAEAVLESEIEDAE